MELILGSASPRRKEILQFFTIPFKQISSDFDESSIQENDPREYVRLLALEKGKCISRIYPHACILTADTDVSIDGKILGKPANIQETIHYLEMLSGRWHSVFTAVAVTCKGSSSVLIEETKVLCNNLSALDIQRYIKGHHLEDKAGGYAIQKSGYMIVNRIEGCFYNVMGLPLTAVRTLLLEYGIDLWEYLGT